MKELELSYIINELLDAFLVLDSNASIVISLVLFIGVLLLILAVSRLWQRRFLAAGIRGAGGLCCLFSAIIALLMILNFHTYYRLTHEKPLVKLTFIEQGYRQYRVTLEYLADDLETDSSQYEYLLAGDEWQVDARVIRWKPLVQLLGFNAIYRLERLNGRYSSVTDELSQPRTVYDLSRKRGLDVWSLSRHLRKWPDWIDAYYGSASYLPMQDGAEFVLVINQSGLLARPENAIAKQAVQNW